MDSNRYAKIVFVYDLYVLMIYFEHAFLQELCNTTGNAYITVWKVLSPCMPDIPDGSYFLLSLCPKAKRSHVRTHTLVKLNSVYAILIISSSSIIPLKLVSFGPTSGLTCDWCACSKKQQKIENDSDHQLRVVVVNIYGAWGRKINGACSEKTCFFLCLTCTY